MPKILTAFDLHQVLSQVITLPENITSITIGADVQRGVVLRIECLLTSEQGQAIANVMRGYELVEREADRKIEVLQSPSHDQEQPT